MRVPFFGPISGRCAPLRCVALIAMMGGLPSPILLAAPRPQPPAVKLLLKDLGYPGASQNFTDAGASMLTAHFVDSNHLLVTYSLRGLVERLPDDPPEDDDRAVAGILVELPSGKVLARTRWHLHDHGQYLWSLGGGRFLVRVRTTLSAIAPMANLASGDAFHETLFVHMAGRVDGIQVSPEGDLMTLETTPPVKKAEPKPSINWNADGKEPREAAPAESIAFLRIHGDGSPESPVQAIAAGTAKAAGVGLIPLNGRGYLFATATGRNRWSLQFDSFDGGMKTLSSVDSSCPPRMDLTSPGQFIAFTCRGSDDRVMLAAFDFAPHEMWEEPLGSGNTNWHFGYAPAAGRFVMSRMIPHTSLPADNSALSMSGPPSDIQPAFSQEVRVYQTQSGDLLLKTNCDPVLKAGQNFDLSPDGLNVLVVREGAVEVFRLPELTAADRADLAEVHKYEPAVVTAGRVELRRMMRQAATAQEPEAPAEPAPAAATSGDVPTRKAPSLLRPGESAEQPK